MEVTHYAAKVSWSFTVPYDTIEEVVIAIMPQNSTEAVSNVTCSPFNGFEQLIGQFLGANFTIVVYASNVSFCSLENARK